MAEPPAEAPRSANDQAMEALLAEKRQQLAEHEQLMLNTHPGDIIQITNPAHDWHPALLVVQESKKWGLQAFAFVPRNDGQTQQNPIRLKWGVFQKVGECAVLPADLLAARRDSIETARQVAAEQAAAGGA